MSQVTTSSYWILRLLLGISDEFHSAWFWEEPPVTFQHHPAMPKAWGLPLPAGRFETKGAAEKLDAAGKSGGAWKRQLPPEAAGALVALTKHLGPWGKTAGKMGSFTSWRVLT